jgi:hypothetical protein
MMKYLSNKKRKGLFLIGMIVLLSLMVTHLLLPVSAEESMTIYCYRDNRSLGSVAVFDIAHAVTACNNLYYECKGKCVGCYHDFDYIDYVCVDASGRTFLR